MQKKHEQLKRPISQYLKLKLSGHAVTALADKSKYTNFIRIWQRYCNFECTTFNIQRYNCRCDFRSAIHNYEIILLAS